jgi:putative membrane protein
MKRLLAFAAVAVAAGMLAKRAWEARHLPLAAGAGDRESDALDEPQDARWSQAAPAGDEGVLGALTAFDEHVVACAEMALNRPLADATQTLAALLRDEHREHLSHTRALIERLEWEPGQDPAVAEFEAQCYARRSALASEDDADFETGWLAAIVYDHERMLDFIDEILSPVARDERVFEHLRLTRTHLEAHLAEARMLA